MSPLFFSRKGLLIRPPRALLGPSKLEASSSFPVASPIPPLRLKNPPNNERKLADWPLKNLNKAL